MLGERRSGRSVIAARRKKYGEPLSLALVDVSLDRTDRIFGDFGWNRAHGAGGIQ